MYTIPFDNLQYFDDLPWIPYHFIKLFFLSFLVKILALHFNLSIYADIRLPPKSLSSVICNDIMSTQMIHIFKVCLCRPCSYSGTLLHCSLNIKCFFSCFIFLWVLAGLSLVSRRTAASKRLSQKINGNISEGKHSKEFLEDDISLQNSVKLYLLASYYYRHILLFLSRYA